MSQTDCAPRDAIDQIEIKSPCTVSWDEMRPAGGDGRVRFCGQCRQNVYNVEAMGRGEARRLIAAREGRLCVRILRRPDGTVVTADCWARLRAARRRGLWPFLGMLVLVGFTELIAMGAGLARLRNLWTVAGGEAARPRVSLPISGQTRVPLRPIMGGLQPLPPPPRMMGKLASRPPEREMGHRASPPPTKHHYTLGAPRPRVEEPDELMGLFE
jgi:hypothetical protein